MGSITPDLPQPWVKTPLIYSSKLSEISGCTILLKLDLLQPSGSFKSRGIGHMMAVALSRHPDPEKAHFYSSSGGNAGLACATTTRSFLPAGKRGGGNDDDQRLGPYATIVVPTTTTALMVSKLREQGAEVVQVGENWAAADKYLHEELLSRDPNGIYVPPFDHEDIWTGASSMVDEIFEQLDEHARIIDGAGMDAIVCNIGGGGLFCGIMEGLARAYDSSSSPWAQGKKPKVLAMETVGADSLYRSILAGENITMPAIKSIATSLGASRVADKTFEWATSEKEDVVCATVTDKEAVDAAISFADHERMLVEVACGASIAPVYTGQLRNIVAGGKKGGAVGDGMSDEEWKKKTVVVIVCGGSNTGVERLLEYRKMFDSK